MSPSSSQSIGKPGIEPGNRRSEDNDQPRMERDPVREMSEADRVRHDQKNTIFSITVQCACGRLSLEEGRLHEVRDCLMRISGLAKKLSEELVRPARRDTE